MFAENHFLNKIGNFMKNFVIGLTLVSILNVTVSLASSDKEGVKFPGAISDLVPELDKDKLIVNQEGGLAFVAWKYGQNAPISINGQEVCKFLGFKSYVDSTIKEVKALSLKVVIPEHTTNCVGAKYCWGWQNAQQDGDYPEYAKYTKNRYGWIAPFMIFDTITCADKI